MLLRLSLVGELEQSMVTYQSMLQWVSLPINLQEKMHMLAPNVCPFISFPHLVLLRVEIPQGDW